MAKRERIPVAEPKPRYCVRNWRAYNDAAIAQMFIEKLPELARAIAEPLGKTDKITIISTGDGAGLGASRLTKDIVDIISQLPPVLEGVSGVSLKDIISRVPSLAARLKGATRTPPADLGPRARRQGFHAAYLHSLGSLGPNSSVAQRSD